jgi:hypothetical protein
LTAGARSAPPSPCLPEPPDVKERSYLKGKVGPYDVVLLSLLGMGNARAGTMTKKAIASRNPSVTRGSRLAEASEWATRRPWEQLPPRVDRSEPTHGAEADRTARMVEKTSDLSRNHAGAHVRG